MSDFQHENKCLNILVQHCRTQEQYGRMLNYLCTMQKDPKNFGLVGAYEAYMSTDRYYNISQLISDRETAVVVDCGCGEGLQQLLFQDCKRYIGIDIVSTPILLTDNALFYQGNVKDVLPSLEEKGVLKGDVYCISVLAGMCFPDIREAMYKYNKVINV